MLKTSALLISTFFASPALSAVFAYEYFTPTELTVISTEDPFLTVGGVRTQGSERVLLTFDTLIDGPLLGQTVAVTDRNYSSTFFGSDDPDQVSGTVTINGSGEIIDFSFFAAEITAGVASESFSPSKYEIYFEPMEIYSSSNPVVFSRLGSIAEVPLPASVWLMALGLGALGLRGRAPS